MFDEYNIRAINEVKTEITNMDVLVAVSKDVLKCMERQSCGLTMADIVFKKLWFNANLHSIIFCKLFVAAQLLHDTIDVLGEMYREPIKKVYTCVEAMMRAEYDEDKHQKEYEDLMLAVYALPNGPSAKKNKAVCYILSKPALVKVDEMEFYLKGKVLKGGEYDDYDDPYSEDYPDRPSPPKRSRRSNVPVPVLAEIAPTLFPPNDSSSSSVHTAATEVNDDVDSYE